MTAISAPAIRSLTREELYELVWSRPMTSLATELGLSDVALHKTCRRHGIPKPPQGWWSKVRHGEAASPPPLPPRDGEDRIVIGARAGPSPGKAETPRPAVPAKLPRERRDPLVTCTMSRLRKAEPDYRGLVTWRDRRAFRVQVGRSSLDRVELVLRRLASAVRARGLAFSESDQGAGVGARTARVKIKLTEMTAQVPLSAAARSELFAEMFGLKKPRPRASQPLPVPQRIPEWNHVPDGRLRVDLKLGERRDPSGAVRAPQHWIFHDADTWTVEVMVEDIAEAIAVMAACGQGIEAAPFRR